MRNSLDMILSWLAPAFLLLLLTPPAAPVLYCYVCDDCPDTSLRPLRHMAACPDESYVSCIATLTKFANFKTISRGCSKAPAVSRRRGQYNKYNGAVCSQHTVNIMRATVCLCGRDTCNGPSLPPKDLLDNDEDMIDIEEVVREMNEIKEAQPEPIASGSARPHPRLDGGWSLAVAGSDQRPADRWQSLFAGAGSVILDMLTIVVLSVVIHHCCKGWLGYS